MPLIRVSENVNDHLRPWYECSCGEFVVLYYLHVETGNTKSCGCLHRKRLRGNALRLKHGHSFGTPEYRAYSNAKQRCTNSKNNRYKQYGGRGIKFLFLSFEEFYLCLGNRPKGMSLDRRDNDGHYEPRNVRWATKEEQHNNRQTHYRKAFQKSSEE